MPAQTEQYASVVYGVEQGLPDMVVHVVLQTRDGHLWAGTDNGLTRFDGKTFTTFRANRTPGLGNNTVRCLYQDDEGTLWIGTQAGLSTYRDGKLERVPGIEIGITCVLKDRTGRLWLGTRSYGLQEYSNGKLVAHNDGLSGEANLFVRALTEDSTGKIWVGVGYGPPLFLENGRFQRLQAEGLGLPGVGTITEHPRGTLWFSSGATLFRLRAGQIETYGREAGLGFDLISSTFADRDGSLWVAARRVLRLEHPDAKIFSRIPVNNADQCRHITLDHEGSYWIGTAGFGIVKLRETAFQHFKVPLLASNETANTVTADPAGALSFGVFLNGVVRVNPDGTFQRIDTGALPQGEVLSVYSARDGRLWIGRRDTMLVWDKGNYTEKPQARGVRAIYEASDGAMWLGSDESGVVRYKDGVVERINPALGVRDTFTATSFGENDGAFFVGLRVGGLAQQRGGETKIYNSYSGHPLDAIRAIRPDKDGLTWVGTRGQGLVLLKGGQAWNPEVLSEPFHGHVSCVELDDRGNIFVGTSRGILWATREQALTGARGELRETPFRWAGESEGIKPSTVGFGIQPASAKTPDGRLWFATRQGVIVVDPRRLRTNTAAPQVNIVKTWINEAPADLSRGKLEIPAGAATVRIDYNAPSFVNPDRVFFRYKLEGYDENWIEAGTRRTAFYTTLPPGKYRFQVRACNDDGVWSPYGASLAVTQTPHFYQTLWFKILAVCVFTGTVVLIVRYLTRRNLQRRLEALERERSLNRERTRIARDLHDEIGGSVTKIGYLVDRLDRASSQDRIQVLQKQLSWQTQLLTSDLDRVVWSVSPANNTLDHLATFTTRFVRNFLRETSIRVVVESDTDIPSVQITPEIQHHLLAVIKEAINNVLKHANATEVTLDMSFKDRTFHLRISDNGTGFEPDRALLAERNGLTNMRARIVEIGGTFDMESSPGKGTTLRMAIPITTTPSPQV